MTRFLCSSLLFVAGLAAAEPPGLLLQKPTMNRTHIVFVYAGDLWSVPREGGSAIRLTTSPGGENHPMFSPDGSQIAFTGEYDGNDDVFVIPAGGGVPKRLTWHPAPDVVLGWTPDGKNVLFASPRTAYSRFNELFTISAAGGHEDKLPLPSGFEGSLSPNGQRIAYVPIPRAFAAWKRYRGGRTTKIWLANLSDSAIEKIHRTNSNDFNPMWDGDKVYFLSDRNGPVSLFEFDTKAKAVKQSLPNTGLDLKSASAGPGGAIVYEQFGGIHLFDTSSGKSKQVPITVHGDFPELRARLVNVGKSLGSPGISPSGARALFTARGEIVTVPAEKGDPRVITNTPGVMERDPQWSPDGQSIACFSDESGEYALHVRAQNGAGEVSRYELEPGFYRSLRWSPDSKKVSFVNHDHVLFIYELDAKKQTRIDESFYTMGGFSLAAAWSPDSKWIAYSRLGRNVLNAIHLYSLADGKSTQITDGMSDAQYPVFDKDGKYLYFAASTDAGNTTAPDLHSMQRRPTRSIYLVVLDRTLPSPFAPQSDDEKPAESDNAKPDAPKPDAAKPAGSKPKAPVMVKIDLDGIDQRILSLPMPARRYVSLQVGKAGTLLAVEALTPAPGAPPASAGATLHRFDLKARKADAPLTGLNTFAMSEHGERALYRQGNNWIIAALRPMPTGSAPVPPAPPSSAPPLKVDGVEVRVEPVEEWKQMFREAWRYERYFFYDPKVHGVDVRAVSGRYEPYLNSVVSRRDLTYLFQEMMGELSVGHLNAGGGDIPDTKKVQTGLLGCDYAIDGGRYRFARVFSGENWNPQLRAPLTQPGVNVKAGEYLIAVNGRDVRADANVYSYFEGLADKSVLLKVAADAAGTNAREVTVVPVPNDTGLRNLAWIEENRRKVDQMTGGRVAYVYMPDTANGGITAFNRYFYAQVDKEGAIIDERYNGGGMLATDIVEILNRKVLSATATRRGPDLLQPQGAIYGPKVMIINETAGSGGDAMPWYFRRAGAGKLIGTRTWGGLVGMAGTPPLMDGGFVSAPASGVYNPMSGEWEVENIGIAPDIEVEQDPAAVRKGRDPQLERAVQTVLEELKKTPAPKLRRPTYPNYHMTQTAAGK